MKTKQPKEPLTLISERYCLAYQGAKAAFKAYAAMPSHDLFELALDASNAFILARLQLQTHLQHYGGTMPPNPP